MYDKRVQKLMSIIGEDETTLTRGGIRPGAFDASAESQALQNKARNDKRVMGLLERLGMKVEDLGTNTTVKDVEPFRSDVQELKRKVQDVKLPSQLKTNRQRYSQLQETGGELTIMANAQNIGTKKDVFQGNYTLNNLKELMNAQEETMGQYEDDLSYLKDTTDGFETYKRNMKIAQESGNDELTRDLYAYGTERKDAVPEGVTRKEIDDEINALVKEISEAKGKYQPAFQDPMGMMKDMGPVYMVPVDTSAQEARLKELYGMLESGNYVTDEQIRSAEENYADKFINEYAQQTDDRMAEIEETLQRGYTPEGEPLTMEQRDALLDELEGMQAEYDVLEPQRDLAAYVGTGLMKGFSGFANAAYQTYDVVLGKPIDLIVNEAKDAIGKVFNVNTGAEWRNPLSRWADKYKTVNQQYVKEAEDAVKNMRGSAAWEIGQEVISGLVQNIPNAVLSYMTGGAAAASGLAGVQSAAQQALTTAGAGASGIQAVRDMITDPQYWLSFSQTLGNDYNDALEKSGNPVKAALYAMFSGIVNAGIEIGPSGKSGIQGINQADEGGNVFVRAVEAVTKKDIGAFGRVIDSASDEAMEELEQGIVSGLAEKALIDASKPIISATDDNAIISPEIGKQMVVGGLTGGLMAGGAETTNAAINRLQTDEGAQKYSEMLAQFEQELQNELTQGNAQASTNAATNENTEAGRGRITDLSGEVTAYEYGKSGRSLEELNETLESIGVKMSNEISLEYTRGETARETEKQSYIKRVRELNAGKGIKNREGTFRSISQEELQRFKDMGIRAFSGVFSDKQQAAVKALRGVAEKMHLNMVYFESPTNEDGERVGANGFYDSETNTVYLDAFAGKGNEQAMMKAAAHELTHVIKQWSAEKYGEYQDMLVKYYYSTGKNTLRELVQAQMTKAEENGVTLTESQAMEEVVADASEMMFSDVDAMSEIARTDKTLFEKIGEWITRFVDSIKTAMEGIRAGTKEAELLMNSKETWERARKTWYAALEESGRNLGGETVQTSTATKTKDAVRVIKTQEFKKNMVKTESIAAETNATEKKEATKHLQLNKRVVKSEGISGETMVRNEKVEYRYALMDAGDLNVESATQATESEDGGWAGPIVDEYGNVKSMDSAIAKLTDSTVLGVEYRGKYRAWLKKNAQSLGLDPKQIGENDVLVRVVSQKQAPAAETVQATQAETKAQPQTVQPEEATRGSRGVAYTADQKPIEYHYELKSADDLIASNTTAFEVNEAYPQELQPRDRQRQASRDQVWNMARNLNPVRLGESVDVQNGAPIIGTDNVVESGNGRVLAMKVAMQYKEKSAGKYTQWLRENAKKFGVNPESVSENSILVRVRDSDVDRKQFVKEANESTTASYSESESAQSDSEKLTPEMLELFVPSDSGKLDTRENNSFVTRFLDKVIPRNERASYVQQDGSISQRGWARLRNAIFQKAYGSSQLTNALSEATEDGTKNVIRAMTNAAPRMVQTQEGVKKQQLYDVQLPQAITEAAKRYMQLKREGVDVDVYLAQQKMPGLEEESESAQALMRLFDQFKASPKQLSQALQTVMDVLEEYGEPNQVSMFGEREAPRLADLVSQARQRMESGRVQYSLRSFDDGTRFVDVQTDQDAFNGLSEKEQARKALEIIRKKYQNRVVGVDNRVYVNGRSAKEYAYPAKMIRGDMKAAKMKAAPELDNLIDAGVFVGSAKDGADGHKHEGIDRFDYYKTIFKVAENYFSGKVNVMVTEDGRRLLKDITEIKNITQDITGQYGMEPDTRFLRDVSMNSISENTEEVNANLRFSLRDTDYKTDRQLLASALENVAKDADEVQMLSEYQQIAAKLDADERRVQEINERIRELRLEDPGTAEEQQLLEERRGLERGITNADRKLFRMERLQPLQRIAKIQRKEAEAALNRARRHLERYKEGVEEREYIAKIKRTSDRLAKWLTKPDNQRYVPEDMRKPLAEFLLAIDRGSTTMLSGGRMTKADRDYARVIADLRNVVSNINAYQNQTREGGTQYNMYIDLPRGFVEMMDEHAQKMKAKAEAMGGQMTLNRMNVAELEELYKTLVAISSSITHTNEFLSDANAKTVGEVSRDTIKYLREQKPVLEESKIAEFLNWDNLQPAYAFERYGDGGKQVFKMLQDGQSKLAFNTKEIVAESEKLYTAKEVKAWSEEVKTFKIGGKAVQIPVANIMSLYCIMRRAQGVGHVYGEGFRVGDYELKGKKVRSTGHNVTDAEVKTILGSLTERQKDVAEKLQSVMSTKGSRWGNEVSMKRFGYRMFTEQNYFPIEVDRTHLPARTDNGTGNELYRLLNMSSTKPITRGANNRTMLNNIFDVFSTHMADMATYNSMALPVLDAVKWLNYKESELEEVALGEEKEYRQKYTESVRDAARDTYGNAANKYIIGVLKDINGAQMTGGDGYGKMMLGRVNRAAVAANLRVAFLQPLSIIRAGMVLKSTDILTGAGIGAMHIKRNIQEMDEYSGIAVWKDLGFYDVNIGRGVKKMIKHDETKLDKAIDWSMKGAEWADKMTWALMWEGAKRDVARTVHPTDKNFMPEVAKKFEEVVYKTQVVDSVLTKSQYMRNPSFFTKWTSSFMSEPTTTYNMLLNAYNKFATDARNGNFQKAWQKQGKLVLRTMAVYTVASALNAVVESLMGAWRDEDDYSTFMEKFTGGYMDNFVNNMMPFNKLPLISDVYEYAKKYLALFGVDTYGYSDTNVITQWLEQIYDGLEIVADKVSGNATNYTNYGMIYKLAQGISSVTGIPLASASREAVAMWNNTVGTLTDNKIVVYKTSKSTGYRQMYNAAMAENPERVDQIRAELKENGAEDKEVISGLRKLVKEDYLAGKLAEDEAVSFLKTYCGATDDEAYWKIEEWNWEAADELEDFSVYGELEDALLTGEGAAEAVARLTGHGYEENKVQSKVREIVKHGYLDGDLTEQKTGSLLKQYAGLDDNEVYFKLRQYEYEKLTGDSTSSDACMIFYAIDMERDPKSAIDAAMKHGKTKNGLASSITSRYKTQYLELLKTNKSKAAALRQRLAGIFSYLGYDGLSKVDGWTK